MKKSNIVNIFLLIFILAFFLNLVWEVSHSLLYDWDNPPLENNIQYYIPRILLSTFGDGMYITIIFLINSLINKNVIWLNYPKKRDYLTLIFLGLILAIFIEVKAEILNLWTYNESMPTIFGIGFSPLVQLSITSIFVLLILKKLSK